MNIERPTWIEIDRTALANNLANIRQIIGPDCLLMAVIKANAYGHGVHGVALAAEQAGADRFAVATLSEAVELRHIGVRLPILVLGYTPAWMATDAITQDIMLTIHDQETAQNLAALAESRDSKITVHVKVNTGMNRLGVLPKDAPDFLRLLQRVPGLHVDGIYTHFATSDTDRTFAREQFAHFDALLTALDQANIRPPIAHAANSAATLTMPETHLDMVRCGIALYGLDPDEQETPLPDDFMPVLSWKAHIAQVTSLQPGESVSYGREFVAALPTTVAVIPVGYADGFPRRPLTWGSVLLHGEFAPIVGRVCMDQSVIDVTSLIEQGKPVRQGDEVVLIGRQGEQFLSAEEVGQRIGTINYDVVSRILPRVPRVLVDA